MITWCVIPDCHKRSRRVDKCERDVRVTVCGRKYEKRDGLRGFEREGETATVQEWRCEVVPVNYVEHYETKHREDSR
jgi:hypothetical protein